jgi:hypothetical protein
MFGNKLKMNSIAEAVKKITEESIAEAEKVTTSTGMKVYGSSYGDSAKARRDQVKKDIDTIKGPTTKELTGKDKEDFKKTKGRYDEAAKPDFLDMDKDGDKKEPMKKAVADKKKNESTEHFKNKLIEALKGNQHKIDKNKNNKIDSQDFKILRGQKNVTEDSCEDEAKQEVKKHEKRLHGKDGEVSKHVEKMHKEEVEQIEEKHMTDDDMAKREKIVKSMKKGFAGFRQRYGKDAKSVMYATATKQAMKEDAVEEEIDPKVRTKDTLKGQERTAQSDDVGPNSNGRSTKVKFRGGPMKEEVKKSDIPAFLRKARGDKPLTVADAKAGNKDSISSKENLAKARGVQEGKHPESDTVPFVTNAEQPPFDKPYKKIGASVTDKSGAKHTPMSRARDLARSAMKRIKTEMLGKAPGNNG